MFGKKASNTFFEWNPVSEKIIRARLKYIYCSITVITVNAITETNDYLYNKCPDVINRLPEGSNMAHIINTQINNDEEHTLGPFGSAMIISVRQW